MSLFEHCFFLLVRFEVGEKASLSLQLSNRIFADVRLLWSCNFLKHIVNFEILSPFIPFAQNFHSFSMLFF